MKKIAILGSTGSIGTQALDVIRNHPNEFQVYALAANQNIKNLEKQIQEFNPKLVSLSNEEQCALLKKKYGTKTKILCGKEGLVEIVTSKEVDTVLFATSGFFSIDAFVEALKQKKWIAMATKELIVSLGSLLETTIPTWREKLIPVDSEHSAIFQCIKGEKKENIKRIILTASGGPFLHHPIKGVKKEEVLHHPVWSMGPKTTVDSATLVNKALEIIEAHYLFDIPFKKIEVVIHPQSVIHSMVEFTDNSVIAQLSLPDMRIPIQYALSYPNRFRSFVAPLNLEKIGNLTFLPPDFSKFPALRIAYDVLEKGGIYPAVFAGASAKAVDLFLNDRINFESIVPIIEECITHYTPPKNKLTIRVIEKTISEVMEYMENLIK